MVVRRVRRAVRTIVKALERVQQPRALRGQRRVAPIARPRDRDVDLVGDPVTKKSAIEHACCCQARMTSDFMTHTE